MDKEARVSSHQPAASLTPKTLRHAGAGVMKTGVAVVFLTAAHTNWLAPNAEGRAGDSLIRKQILPP